MPLPSVINGAKQCLAKSKRTGLPCNNPAAHGCRTCRMHGARRQETIRKDKDHPQYKHGHETRKKRTTRAFKLKSIKIYGLLLKKIDAQKKGF